MSAAGTSGMAVGTLCCHQRLRAEREFSCTGMYGIKSKKAGIRRNLLFTLEMAGRAEVVSLFGAGLRIACSCSVGLLCVWWLRGIVLLLLGRRSDSMNPHMA